MKVRVRRYSSQPKDRRLNDSGTERTPMHLPSIDKRRFYMDDEIHISPSYRHINGVEDVHSYDRSHSNLASVKESPIPSHSKSPRFNKNLLPPRIITKCEQSVKLYESIRQRIRNTISERYQQAQRQGMELIHDRYMRLL